MEWFINIYKNMDYKLFFTFIAVVISLASYYRSRKADKRSLKAEMISTEVKIDTDLHEAWDLLGGDIASNAIRKFNNRKDINTAKRLIDICLKLNLNYARSHRIPGLYYEAQGNARDRAEQSYRQAIKLDPALSLAHNNLGILLKATGRPDEAEQSYRQAIKLDPDEARAHTNLGILLSDTGRPDEAEQSYRQAIKLDPDYASAHNNLGNLLKATGRPDEADNP